MINYKTVFKGLALLLILTLAGCGGASKKQTDSGAQQHEDTPAADETILTKMLRNHAKVLELKNVVEFGGQVYAVESRSIPGWKIVPDAERFAVVGNTIIFKSEKRWGPSTDLGLMDLNGGNRILIEDSDVWEVYIAGDKIIYKTRDKEHNVFCYDLKTSKKTRLLDEKGSKEFTTVYSFVDDFIYYRAWSDMISYFARVRWDGTQAEVVEDVDMRIFGYTVKGEYYYYYEEGYFCRYSIYDGELVDKCAYSTDYERVGIVDEWIYFKDRTTLLKTNISTGETVKLVDLSALEIECCMGVPIAFSDGSVYFTVTIYGEEYCPTHRLYKVPIHGGAATYQNLEWESCSD